MTPTTRPESPTHAAPGAPLRAIVERELARDRVPGCSITVVDGAGERWSAGFGHADLASERAAGPETVWPLFSGTKLFTAVAVLRLADEGRLALEDPVERYVGGGEALAGVTLLHLLSHRSGLADTLRAFLAVTLPPDPLPPTADALDRYRLTRTRAPGTKIEYRNVNYALLGEVVTRVTGLEYRDYLSRYVLAPLGMAAGFSLGDAARPEAATGYVGRFDPTRLVLRVLFPALPARLYRGRPRGRPGLVALAPYALGTSSIGGLIGTTRDFGLFLSAQLAGGGAILSPDATRRMQTTVAEGSAGVMATVGVGLGWKVGSASGRTFLNHEGAGAGFTSELRIWPGSASGGGLGVALAMNLMRAPRTMRLAHRICEAVAHHEATAASPPDRPRG